LRPASSRQVYAPQLLLIAYIHIIFELLLRAQVAIYALVDQHGLYRSVAEDDAGGEQAVNDRKEDLDCAQLATICARYWGLHTHALPLGHLERAYGGLFACRFRPRSHGIEAHLAMPAVRARLSAPWLDFLDRRKALRQRHIVFT
jgi:hypothetical protein